MTGITLFIVGLSVGAMLIISAEDAEEDATEIIYNAGYEKGKADEQKKVMQKLEEYRSKEG